jgi:hypothetical protein
MTLRLRTYDEIELGDIGTPGHGDRVSVHLAPPHAEIVAGTAEDLLDIDGSVTELVSRVSVSTDSVEGAAAVRVDEPTKEASGLPPGNLLLPRHELDLALMLPPRSVLGE